MKDDASSCLSFALLREEKGRIALNKGLIITMDRLVSLDFKLDSFVLLTPLDLSVGIGRSNEPFDDERDGGTKDDGINSSFEDNVESSDNLALAESFADLYASTSNSSEDDATYEDVNYDFEGEDFINFDLLCGYDEGDLESLANVQYVWRSSRNSILSNRLQEYELEGKLKHGLNRYVSYVNLSYENYSFVANLNKTVEPKTYREVSTNSKWIEAMNNEMEALNINNTWEIYDLFKGRKPIGCN
ncbi:hypothetical protein Tco_0710938 [Tanacetum coccineum]